MNKKIEIFGKKVPVIALVIALLVIGTASAAVFMNYATLTGTDVIDGPSIYVIDSDGNIVPTGDDGDLNFSSPATFSINNTADTNVTVELNTTLSVTNSTGSTVNDDGITVVYSGDGVNVTTDPVTVVVPAADTEEGQSVVTVTLIYAPNIMAGNCTVTVDVDPIFT